MLVIHTLVFLMAGFPEETVVKRVHEVGETCADTGLLPWNTLLWIKRREYSEINN